MQGRYEIISLSGSFLISDSNGNRSRTGGLSVSLASENGQVLGGLTNMLTAASTVQVLAYAYYLLDIVLIFSFYRWTGCSFLGCITYLVM